MPTIQRTHDEVAQIIENFLDMRGDACDWDDFITFRIADPHLDAVRAKCLALNSTHPRPKGHWCNQLGRDVMRTLAIKLRAPK